MVELLEPRYFKGVKPVQYGGPKTHDPLETRFYQADRVVGGKRMDEHLRFSRVAWHDLGEGADPFETDGFYDREWNKADDPMERARDRVYAHQELLGLSGTDYFAFHDRDVAPEGRDIAETEANYDAITDYMLELMGQTGAKVLWNTPKLFGRRYVDGAASNPRLDVIEQAAAQAWKSLEIADKVGALNHVSWGGREGNDSTLNTLYGQEQRQMAAFYAALIAHASKIGFDGQLLIEPKPNGPRRRHYEATVGEVYAFLARHDGEFGLLRGGRIKANIEGNHATLAGRTLADEMQTARYCGILGSLDFNLEDWEHGDDVDRFYVHAGTLVEPMLMLLEDPIAPGGLNFDAKLRPATLGLDELVTVPAQAMDAAALALLTAYYIRDRHEGMVQERYATVLSGPGKDFTDGKITLGAMRDRAIATGRETRQTAQPERFEQVVERALQDVIGEEYSKN